MDNDGVKSDQLLITMRNGLTTGQKAGYFFAGCFGGIPCAILASLCNLNAPYRSDCTRFAVIGAVTGAVLTVLIYLLMFIGLL